ncbi:MAG: hypothetical protein GY715_13010 [Planctomycetes bacterium]|nr:hypothetical protein [Planctomycetota bacterium]
MSDVPDNDAGWNQFRGEVQAKLEVLTARIDAFSGQCMACKDGQLEEFRELRRHIDAGLERVNDRITATQIREARSSAVVTIIAAVGGATLALAGQFLLSLLSG